MCVKTFNSRTMFIATISVLVSVVVANVNSTAASRMAWMKSLLDHHNWIEYLNNGSLALPVSCEADLRTYLTGLNDGQLWASKSKSILLKPSHNLYKFCRFTKLVSTPWIMPISRTV